MALISIIKKTLSLKKSLHHHLRASSSTFHFSDLEISLTPPSGLKPKPDVDNLLFGRVFTDHMFSVQWEEGEGWSHPRITPFAHISLHPGAKALHYALQLFEGMKAYRGVDGGIRLFRPDLNLRRLAQGAGRILLPSFSPQDFLSCLQKLVTLEQEWVPHSETSSLYIRTTFIGTEPSLEISMSKSALLYVILSPVGPYFPTGFKPVSLLADPGFVRSWPGGCGALKLGANYAPTMFVQSIAASKRLQQVLWLYGPERFLTEVGSMNIFAFVEHPNGGRELVTPPLDGLILPGVTRQSILDLTREWAEFTVTERPLSMEEILQWQREGRLLELFGAGTACVVCPVQSITYEGKEIRIPTVEAPKPLFNRLLKALSDIYYGHSVGHPWGVLVE